MARDGRRAEAEDHAIKGLLARPNSRQGGAEFMEALYGHLLLSGNAFVEPVEVAGELRELHLLRPDRIRVIEGADGWPSAYEYRVGGSVRRFSVEAEPGLLHLRLFHPLDDHMGFAPLEAAAKALDLSNAAASWNKALLDNSARPSGALVYQPKEGGNLSASQYERLKAELAEGYSGPARAGAPCCSKAGSTGNRWGSHPAKWISPSQERCRPRHRARLRCAAHADRHPRRQHLCQLRRSQPRLLAPDRAAAHLPHGGGDDGVAFGVYPEVKLGFDLDQVAGLSAERGELWARVGAAGFLSDAEKRAAVGYDK